MPELPEMETYRRLLSDRLTGKSITQIQINREKSINVPVPVFVEQVQNQQLTSIERRAKHLIFHLNSGKALLLHLMLGGWMHFGDETDAPDRTKQVILEFGKEKLYFIGLRLGYLHLLNTEELEKEFDDLGPEPLDAAFTFGTFVKVLAGRRAALKTTLVNQEIIAGIGNCYSDEICFEAQVKPDRNANDISEKETRSLFQGIKSVLQNAVMWGGYMDNPLFQGDCLTGAYSEKLKVYDREGKPCPRCRGSIVREELSSRKTFFCPNCQK